MIRNEAWRTLGVRLALAVAVGCASGPVFASATLLADLAPGSEARSSDPVTAFVGAGVAVVEGGGFPMTLLDLETGALRQVSCGAACGLSSVRGGVVGTVVATDDWLAVVGRQVSGVEPMRLWAVDPRSARARLLAPWQPFEMRPVPDSSTVVLVRLDQGSVRTLWATDGSAASLRRLDSGLGDDVRLVTLVGASGGAVWMEVLRGNAMRYLARTDGTLAGTVVVGALPGSVAGPHSGSPDIGFTVLAGGSPLFVVKPTEETHELWRATPLGVERIADHATLGCDGVGPFYGNSDGTAEWAALSCWREGNGAPEYSYVVSDGTPAGTTNVAGGIEWSSFTPVRIGDRLVAGGRDGSKGTEPRVIERSGAVSLLADLCPGACSTVLRPWSRAVDGFAPGTFPFFVVRNDGGLDLWVTDGLPGGATPRPLCQGCTDLSGATAVAPHGIYWRFYEPGPARRVAAFYDPATGALTRLLEWQQESRRLPPVFEFAGGRLQFAASAPATGNELWVSDGTVPGTRLRLDRAPGRVGEGSFVQGLARTQLGLVGWGFDGIRSGWWRFDAAGPAFLVASDDSPLAVATDGSRAVWRLSSQVLSSDGSRLDALPLTHARSVAALGPGRFVVIGWGGSLWATDGTAAGIKPLIGQEHGALEIIEEDGSQVLVRTNDLDPLVWRSDGTVAGTRALGPLAGLTYGGRVGDELVWFDSDSRLRATKIDTGVSRTIWEGSPAGFWDWLGIAGDKVIVRSTLGGSQLLGVGMDGVASALSGPSPGSFSRFFRAGARLFVHVAALEDGGAPAVLSIGGDLQWRIDLEGPTVSEATRLIFGSEVVVAADAAVWELTGARLLGAFDDIGDTQGQAWFTKVDDRHVGISAERGPEGLEPWVLGVAAPTARPLAPRNLVVREAGPNAVELQWLDTSANEEGFLLEYRHADSSRWVIAGVVGRDVTGAVVEAPWEAASWRVIAANAGGRSNPSNVAGSWMVPSSGPSAAGSCVADDETLCLGNGRYALEVRWRTEDGVAGVGRPIGFDAAGTTGFFWFFDQANIELVVKMLDGAVLNDHDWLFAGALSNVEYWISAVDTLSGATRSYHNAPGNICGFADIDAFWKQGGGPIGPGFEVASAPAVAESSLSLLGGRFTVEVSWKTPDGATGSGVAVPATDQSGYFWFFDQANLELVVKMLDGVGVNGHYWLFHGALSNVEYEIAVTDQLTSERKVWRNPQGTICGGADIEAF